MQDLSDFDQLNIGSSRQEPLANETAEQPELPRDNNNIQIKGFPQSKVTMDCHEPEGHNSEKNPTLTGIRTLPRELIIRIATSLSPVDRASFALTSRRIHRIIGNALKLNRLDRLSFLSLLGRDGKWPSDILCTICAAFHQPRKNRVWTIKEGNRACIQQGDWALERQSVSPYLPRNIHFDIISAISRSHRLDPKSPLYSPHILDFVSPYIVEQGGDGLRIRMYHTGHISSKGHVLLKTEKILYPGPCTGLDSTAILEGAQDLEFMLKEHTSLGNICGHAKWLNLYPFIFRPELGHVWVQKQWSFRKPDIQDFDLPGQVLQECVWTHKGDCWLHCEAQSRLESSLEGRVWSCGACSTDYAVNIIRLPRSTTDVNFVIMTSWKDLGMCMDRLDTLWTEHLDVGVDQNHDRLVLGEVAQEVDNLTYRYAGEKGETLYYPRISEERLRGWFLSGKDDGRP